MISRFVANSEKCCKYTFLGGSAQIITILHRGGYRNLLQYYMGGSTRFITISQWGGASRDPKFVLRNIYGRPHSKNVSLLFQYMHTAQDLRHASTQKHLRFR